MRKLYLKSCKIAVCTHCTFPSKYLSPLSTASFPHLLPVLLEVAEADVVHDVPGPDEQVDAVAPEQLEVVLVRLVAQEAVHGVCNRGKKYKSLGVWA